MSHRLSLACLCATFVIGLTTTFAAPASAAVCDLNACVSICQKRNPQGGASRACNSYCAITIDQNKKKGQCK
jgi:hypothetical protein